MSLALDTSYEEALDYLEETLAGLLEAGPDPAPVRAAFTYEPVSFGGEFPCLSAVAYQTSREPTAGGSGRSALPHQITLRVRIYYPSLRDRNDTSGRKVAKRKTRYAASLFREALYNTNNLGGQVRELYVSSTRAGDIDAMGMSIVDAASGSILWVDETEVVAIL